MRIVCVALQKLWLPYMIKIILYKYFFIIFIVYNYRKRQLIYKKKHQNKTFLLLEADNILIIKINAFLTCILLFFCFLKRSYFIYIVIWNCFNYIAHHIFELFILFLAYKIVYSLSYIFTIKKILSPQVNRIHVITISK